MTVYDSVDADVLVEKRTADHATLENRSVTALMRGLALQRRKG